MGIFEDSWTIALAGFGGLLIFVFTYFLFPKELEAEGKGRMPSKFVADLLFACLNLLLFVFLIFAVQVGGHREEFGRMLGIFGFDPASLQQAETEVAASATPQGSIEPDAGSAAVRAGGKIGGQVILTAFAAFFGLFGIRRWRGIEAGALAQLHNISLIEEDARDLARALCRTGFSGEEKEDDVVLALERLQQHVPPEAGEAPASSLPDKWRKVEALLRLWEEDDDWSKTLPQAGQPNVSALRHAHDRRARLAEEVSDHVEKVELGQDDPAALASIDALLSQEGGSAEEKLAAMRAAIRDLKSDKGGLSQSSLRRLLSPLSDYFHEEFNDALKQMSLATAKSVVQSGDEAGDRLSTLRERGFSDIGDAPVIDLNNAISMIAVTFGVLSVIFLGFVVVTKLPHDYGIMVFVFAGSISLAVVVAAMVGGLRGLANRRSPPWGVYIMTAVTLSAAHILLVAMVAAGLDHAEPGAPALSDLPFQAFLLGGLFPLVLVLGICWLSRKRRWAGRLEWAMDALVLASLSALAMAATVPVADWQGIDPMLYVDPGRTQPLWMPYRAAIFAGLFGVVGGFIGGFIVHHVRAAATARFVLDRPEEKVEAPAVPMPQFGQLSPAG